MSFNKELIKGIWKENPIFILVLGMCPTLAVSTSVINGVGMGIATTFVLICSNIAIALVRSYVPDQVRIPVYVVLIASFVTVVDLTMNGFFRGLYHALGIFIPLIVVNCIILGRAEAFASKNSVFLSIADAIGMGAGFTLALVMLGSIRELLGNGSLFGFPVFGGGYEPVLVMILPPGAFFTLGILTGVFSAVAKYRSKKWRKYVIQDLGKTTVVRERI
ncbi:MAG: Electron transport complex protein RnfE [Deltaproteobacteria bacterium ADurb.BinA179]|jgi:electron transport complex protein RnfE|nr:electron transport complex subunit E [Deltaproteobacteria bacterium]MDI9544065.1 electron transport complex subunit E [Pseudomonadota bacterium]OPZ27127.1 MAG: Electron transport complex protein RnfE [Deltaproteobacteria bacterium ADurb.BinA179]HOD71345.1 electron transport complex subunit E [Deltaproteobacteria bacterium]HOE73233.1 electron transport complex subunit E [Deltaproteobacteria bacterium]